MGFQLNLKKVGKKKGKTPPTKIDFNEEKAKSTKVDIDSFDGTALANNEQVGTAQPMVIKPAHLVHSLVQEQQLKETIARENEAKLAYGLTETKKKEGTEARTAAPTEADSGSMEVPREAGGLVLDSAAQSTTETTEDEYQRVPVEDFGMAMLRGMGYTGKSESASSVSQILKHRQKGQVLGIGAKPLADDLKEDVMGKRGEKLSVPLIQRKPREGTENGGTQGKE
ncbi:pre-mRNA-splicing factor Spp2p [Diutina catenulata]